MSRADTSIVDGSGTPIKLNAVNLGGHLMWEGWIVGGGMEAETPLQRNLADLVGQERAVQFRARLRAGFVTLADFQAIRSLGFNAVRVPFNHRVLQNDADGGFATLDRLISHAERTGVYVVLDMHGVPGGQNPGFIADPGPGWSVWYDTAAQDETVALWRKIATRYANRRIVAAYDLINEPDAPNPEALVGLYSRIIAGIRTVDPNHMVIVEGNSYAHDFSAFSRLDENIAYSFHQYQWDGTGDPDAKLAQWVQTAEDARVPLWNGEYGEAGHADVEAQVNRFANRPELDGQALWTWKKADRNRIFGFPMATSPAPMKFAVSDAWFGVIHFMSTPWIAPRPSAEAAEAGLRSFMAEVNVSRTTPDPRLASILEPLRQGPAAVAPDSPPVAPDSPPVAPAAPPPAKPTTQPAPGAVTAPVLAPTKPARKKVRSPRRSACARAVLRAAAARGKKAKAKRRKAARRVCRRRR